VLEIAAGHPMRVLLSDRFDVALAAGVHGVHLTTRSMTASVVRRSVGHSLLIGASTHDEREISEAERGADFAVCGPLFETGSKRGYGPPLGVERVATLALHCSIPVFGLGGVTSDNVRLVPRPPLAGIAAIGVFHDAWSAGGLDGLRSVAADLRSAV
jgi:thiamine-phosphate pyrophosphorylase